MKGARPVGTGGRFSESAGAFYLGVNQQWREEYLRRAPPHLYYISVPTNMHKASWLPSSRRDVGCRDAGDK